MTPTERAQAYWDAQRKAEDCSLAEHFKRCEDEAYDKAAKFTFGYTNEKILGLKH